MSDRRWRSVAKGSAAGDPAPTRRAGHDADATPWRYRGPVTDPVTSAQRQTPELRERLELTGERVTLRVIPQHPRVTPDPVEVKVNAPVLAGPVGPDLAVFDYNRERDLVLAPAIPRRDGSFPEYPVDDPRFHQLNAYAIAARAIDLAESELGRLLGWGFEANRLIVLPHAGYLANAFYDEDSHSLQFFSFRQGDGTVYHTSLVHDIVAHETGHALLDAVRDRYTEGNHPHTAALHEAIGDLAAVFAAFSHEVVRERFLAAAGTDLRGPNEVASIAEDFEASTAGRLALRDLAVTRPPSFYRSATDPHLLSLQLSAAAWEALVRMYGVNRDRQMEPEPAFRLARTALQRMVVRALDYLPPADATFGEFAVAMFRADRFANPDDAIGYRPVVAGALAGAGVIDRVEDVGAAATDDADPAWPARPRTWPRLTPAEAYVFLDANRRRLALAPQARYRDFVVRDVLVTSRPPDHELLDEVILVYEYPVDVELDGRRFGSLGGYWLPVWGGGTLVFDAEGRLRHHAEKPVTRERIREALRFLETVAESSLTRMDPTAEDRLRASAARVPYVAAIAGDRLALRANPAVRCGARPSLGEEGGR
jgi:hypothetical protein